MMRAAPLLVLLLATDYCLLSTSLRSGRRGARRDDPELGGAGLARAAVERDDARAFDAAGGDDVVARALRALRASPVALVTAAVADDVALGAGAVLQLDGEDVEARLLVVALYLADLVELGRVRRRGHGRLAL